MTTPEDIHGWLGASLDCEYLKIDGDGHHFFAVIVSPAFAGQSRIQRQQTVHKALGGRIESGEIHALSMRTFTPEEWETQGG